MGRQAPLGEFELMILLTILQLDDAAYASAIIEHLRREAGRRTSRGALYSSLERLEQKGYLRWEVQVGDEARDRYPKRRFEVTRAGIAALRRSRAALYNLFEGLDHILGGSAR